MQTTHLAFALVLGFCGCWALPDGNAAADREAALSQRSEDLSAVKRKPRRATARPPSEPVRHFGGADPSLGPDGRPYPVPEYLRGQCYIDEGYGRFSACNNRP